MDLNVNELTSSSLLNDNSKTLVADRKKSNEMELKFDDNDAEKKSSASSESAILMSMIRGYQLSQVLYVTAQLGIADILACHDRMNINELSKLTDTHAPSLEHLLRALIHVNIFRVDEDGYYYSTSLSKLLEMNSLRSTVLTWVEPCLCRTWSSLLNSIKTGESSFERLYGMNFYQYLGQNPNINCMFNECMASGSRHEQFVQIYDGFSNVNCVVDIGGGIGKLLISLLTKHKHLRGILYDLPHVINTINLQHLDKSVADRFTIISGDMFNNIPIDGDIYIISNIFMDLNDAKAQILLRNCRQAMKNGKCLLIIDVCMTSSTDVSTDELWKELSNLHMLVLLGGKFRTQLDFQTLLEKQNFKLNRIIPIMNSLVHVGSILECFAT
ncbi:unnamed protein product [Didymodactylos carnosus]|uniref:Acetylserotonin O-methyltransferase n=1 Tax=Didymodactylos carnosus TaxID=1234261 RepID=A0A815JPL6_9BILA|nr:unnamed protein product [Didymodactylos carnosus]CAF1591026.1 unnamed protein product [Didymodactylos carnosus]CAF4277142.1 unnamed protein product [Didymodactylos carnosus]CAF4394870.1 unnamed protein product [Didymodactylos carnosus]